MQNMSTQLNQSNRCVFSIEMECLEKSLELIQNIRQQIDYKKPSNTNQVNRVQRFELKYGKTKLSNIWKFT